MTEKKSALDVYRERAVAIAGSYVNPKEVSEQLQYAAQHLHLVSPATSVGHLPPGESELRKAVERAVQNWPGDEITAADCLERCLEAARQFARNAHQANLVECWLDDLANIVTTGRSSVRVAIRE